MVACSWLKKAGLGALVALVMASNVYADEAKKTGQNDAEEPSLWQAWKKENISAIGTVAQQLVGLGCQEVSATHYPELYAEINKLVVAAKIAQPKIFVVDPNSAAGLHLANAQMPVSLNAFASGLDSDKASLIVISTDLVDIMTPAEVTSIVAHEISHLKYEHVKKILLHAVLPGAVVLGLAKCASIFYADSLVDRLPVKVASYLRRHPEDYNKIVDTSLYVAFAAGVLSFIRHCEKQADLSAVALTKNKTLASALEKLEKATIRRHPFSARIQRWISAATPFLRSHPTTETRKKYIEAAKIEQEAVGAQAVQAGA